MYCKISNSLDLRCVYQWLSQTQGENTFVKMAPVIDSLSRRVKILEEEYKGNHNPDYRGGYVVFFDRPIQKDDMYVKEILDYYNLEEGEYEYEDLLCTCLSKEHTKVAWMERLYILSDFHIVLVYPVEEGRV